MRNFVWKLDTWSMSHCFGASQVPKIQLWPTLICKCPESLSWKQEYVKYTEQQNLTVEGNIVPRK